MRHENGDGPQRGRSAPGAVQAETDGEPTSHRKCSAYPHGVPGCPHRPPAPGERCELCGHPAPRAEDYVAVDPNGGPEWAFDPVSGRWAEVEVAA
jgi:hypothetical protein